MADDGTTYATQTGVGGPNPDATTWQVWKITREGAASIFVHDAGANQLVIPMNANNALAFIPLN